MYFCYLNKQNIALIRNRDKSVWVSQGHKVVYSSTKFSFSQQVIFFSVSLCPGVTKSFQEFINRENSLVSFLVTQYRRSDLTLPSSDTIYNEWHLPWYKWCPPWAPSRTGGTRSSRRPTPGQSGEWGACCAWRVHLILLSLNGLVHQCIYTYSLMDPGNYPHTPTGPCS